MRRAAGLSVKPLHGFSASLVRSRRGRTANRAVLKSQTGPGLGQMSQKENFWSSWQERLSALRNVPPVLKIVWKSGPGVVTFGIVARVTAALLPIALTYIAKLIIDILVGLLQMHGSVP